MFFPIVFPSAQIVIIVSITVVQALDTLGNTKWRINKKKRRIRPKCTGRNLNIHSHS